MFYKPSVWIRAGKLLVAIIASTIIMSTNCFADHDTFSGDDKKYQTGKKVFADYCSRCHGEHADGRSEAIPLYIKMQSSRPSNFRMKFYSTRPKQYMAKIVRDGGGKHSLSEYMPPFGGELSKGQINDVVYFIQKFSTNVASSEDKDKLTTDKK